MSSLLISFVALLLVGGAVLATLATLVWRRRSTDSGSELTVLLLAALVWVLGATAEHLSGGLGAKILASQIQYLGILTLPPAAVVTVLRATGRTRYLRPYLAIAAPFSAIAFLTVCTNDWHHLIWSRVGLEVAGGMPLMTVEYGPGFQIVTLGSHLQLVAAALLFIWSRRRTWHADATLACLGFAAPWVANLFYMMRLGPWPNLDLTPLGLVVTGASFAISFHGLGRVFSTVNLAHRDILDHIADLVLVFDLSGRLLSANRTARTTLALPSLPTTTERALSAYGPLLHYALDADPGQPRDIEVRIEDQTRVFDARSVPVTSMNPAQSGRVLVLRDVTTRRRAETRNRIHRGQLRQIIDLIPHPVYATDTDGDFLFANDACAALYHQTPDEIVGRSLADLHHDQAELDRMRAVDRRIIEQQRSLTIEEVVANGTGVARTYRTTKVPFPRADSESAAVVGVSIDVTKERDRERLLETLASTDSLTNLTNRRSFQEILTRAIDTADHNRHRAALLFLDLDRFKMVNDVYGHLAGDEILRQVAVRVEESVRFNDAIWTTQNAPADATTVSRFGGDEFIVLLPKVDSASSAAIVARRLIDSLDRPFEVGHDSLQLGASIGIAVFPADGADSETLLRHCDQALTSAKRAGRRQFEFFNQRIGAAEERRHLLEKGLRRALDCGELSIHFQPIRNLTTAEIAGAEALLRWTSDELGSISPEEFIPIVEDSGLIVPIGLFVVQSVCEQMADWQRRHYRLPRISINLSARQLVAPESASQLAAILADSGISGGDIEFELTEGSILAQTPLVERTLSTLRDLGASFALDDFGTGYSSLSHVRRFDFQRLKIDRSFVDGIGTSDDDEKLTRAVIALAKQLEMKTVAEGVETEKQLEFLRREGCDFAQGFLLGRPMSAVEFEALLVSEKTD